MTSQEYISAVRRINILLKKDTAPGSDEDIEIMKLGRKLEDYQLILTPEVHDFVDAES